MNVPAAPVAVEDMNEVVRFEDHMHCPRCQRAVRPIRPWPHWGRVRIGYFCGLGLALFGSPVILADGFILIPTLMIYISAIGPLNRLARQKPSCSKCSSLL